MSVSATIKSLLKLSPSESSLDNHCEYPTLLLLTTLFRVFKSSSVFLTSAQLAGEGGGRSPLPFFENRKKKRPDFLKKLPEFGKVYPV